MSRYIVLDTHNKPALIVVDVEVTSDEDFDKVIATAVAYQPRVPVGTLEVLEVRAQDTPALRSVVTGNVLRFATEADAVAAGMPGSPTVETTGDKASSRDDAKETPKKK